MSHHKSLRVAPADADDERIHLKNNIQACESKFYKAVGIQPPYDWSFCVIKYDKKNEKWIDSSLETFDDFSAADDYFQKNDQKEVADRLHIVEDQNDSKGRYPKG